MKNIALIVASILISSIPVFSQNGEPKNHPIDTKLTQCLAADSSQNTAGMINCVQIAVDEWDKELNSNYKLLMGLLNEEEKAKLKASQLKWIEYRDKEFELSRAIHSHLEGTMWLVVAANRKLELIKQRAIELKDYYDLLTM